MTVTYLLYNLVTIAALRICWNRQEPFKMPSNVLSVVVLFATCVYLVSTGLMTSSFKKTDGISILKCRNLVLQNKTKMDCVAKCGRMESETLFCKAVTYQNHACRMCMSCMGSSGPGVSSFPIQEPLWKRDILGDEDMISYGLDGLVISGFEGSPSVPNFLFNIEGVSIVPYSGSGSPSNKLAKFITGQYVLTVGDNGAASIANRCLDNLALCPNGRTTAFWIYFHEYPTDVEGGVVISGQSMEIRVGPATSAQLSVTLFRSSNVTWEQTAVSSVISAERWTHVAAIWNPSPLLMLLIDGKIVNHASAWVAQATARQPGFALSFGCSYDLSSAAPGGDTCMAFEMIDVMIWEKEKSKTFMCQLYSAMD